MEQKPNQHLAASRSRPIRRQKKPYRRQKEAREAIRFIPGTTIGSPYRLLSDHDVERVHEAALTLLEKVGMAAPTKRVRELCLARGCGQSEGGRLLFPRALVEDAIATAAKTFTVHGRDQRFDFEAANGKVNFCTGGAAVSMLDSESGTYRPSTLRDLYDLARLCDTLENIQWFARPVVTTDIEDTFELDVNTVYACAAGTQKHIATSITQGEHVHRLLPLLDILGGGEDSFRKRPFCTVHATTVVSPMTFAADSLDVACAAVDIGMPIHLQTGPQAGATAPAALAGTLAQGCAESLASLTVINLLRPGHPCVLGNWAFVSDLRTGAFSGGGGEAALLGAASGQMSAFYGIPGGMGAGMSDSKVPDNQAGFEKALTLSFAALSGSGFVYESAGMLASLLGCSHEAMVIDDEILSSIRRIARGIEVSEETLSLGVIAEAVNGPGHFLRSHQTMELMETEFDYPRHGDRASPVDWQAIGVQDTWQRACSRVKEILASHYPVQIPVEADDRIRAMFPIKLHPCWREAAS
ncbi:MAG: trimethylamine methyltransferase family protein [Pseudomonadota bacterium]